jgi:hypothetical protein
MFNNVLHPCFRTTLVATLTKALCRMLLSEQVAGRFRAGQVGNDRSDRTKHSGEVQRGTSHQRCRLCGFSLNIMLTVFARILAAWAERSPM